MNWQLRRGSDGIQKPTTSLEYADNMCTGPQWSSSMREIWRSCLNTLTVRLMGRKFIL